MRRIVPRPRSRSGAIGGTLLLLIAPATAHAARAVDQLAEGDVFFLRLLLGLGTLPAIVIAFVVLLLVGGCVATVCMRMTGSSGAQGPEA